MKKKQFITIYLELELSGKPLTKELIKEKCSGGNTKKDFFYHFDEYYKKKFRKIEEGPQYHYELFRKQLKEYRTNIDVSVNRDLKKIARIAKIKKRLTFHVGRHSFGSMLAKNGIQPFLMMKLMGHTDIRMTQRYVNSDEEILTNAIKNRKLQLIMKKKQLTR